LRKSGWSLWLKGNPGDVGPFRSLDPKFLPSKAVKDRLKLEWHAVFQMMENAIDFNLPSKEDDTTQTFINNSYDACTSYLKTLSGYVWESKNKKHFV
jgi:hypothetical protein